MPNGEQVKIQRWVLVIVVTAVLGLVSYLAKQVWEEHCKRFEKTERNVETLIREF